MKEHEYKEIEGTFFDIKTPEKVCQILNRCIKNRKTRIRVFYGDKETGRDWMEEYNTMGYIGRSTGRIKTPLLLITSRSLGGGALRDSCIVKITENKRVLYQHPLYNTPVVKVEKDKVLFDGKIHANCGTEEHAKTWAKFITGERNSK